MGLKTFAVDHTNRQAAWGAGDLANFSLCNGERMLLATCSCSFPPPGTAARAASPAEGRAQALLLGKRRTEAPRAPVKGRRLLVSLRTGGVAGLSYLACIGYFLCLLSLPLTLVAGRAVCLRLVGLEGRLELYQLTHEVEVRRNDRPPRFHIFVGIHHGSARVLHEVGDHDGRGTRHTSLAMHQHTFARLSRLICWRNKHLISMEENKQSH